MHKLTSHLFALLFVCYAYSQNTVNVSSHPSWIDYQEYNPSPEIEEAEISQGALTLLADYQTNVHEQEVYYRLVTKITDNVGVQNASNINAVYDPLYQKLTFHAINIIRDGKEINKLNPNDFQVIRRELNAENYLYDGTLSAMLNLSDVRNGDIIDLSYTIKGFNPIHKGKFSDSFVLNDYVPVGKINVSINTKSTLNYKLYNTTQEPKISKENGYQHYNWTVETPERFPYEENIPSWKIVMPTVILSDYSSWEEVVNWATPIYKTSEPSSKVLKTKVSEISSAHATEGEKIKAILDFVQNDIRYLGLEYGIGGYKPHSPNQVFEQRYGDCKDKSLLMVQMLKEINVNAYPMLLSTSMKGTITTMPPSPAFFDHCVVKVIDKNDRELYYDPTISNQGGTYKNTHFPNYKYGLVVKEKNIGFDTITSHSNNKVTTLEEFIIHEINGGATLNVTTTYTDVEADQLREYFKNNSESSIVKDYENYYANYYSKVKMVKEPSVTDNLLKNEFQVKESYTIDSIWQPMQSKKGYIAIEFLPASLRDILYIPNMENRTNEMSLPYPVSREHKTTIKLPRAWSVEKDSDLVSNDILYYDYSVDYSKKKKEIYLKSYLKIQKPSVKPDEFDTYNKALKELDDSFGYSIFIPKGSSGSQNENYFLTFSKVVFVFGLIIVLIFFLIWMFSKKKKTSV